MNKLLVSTAMQETCAEGLQTTHILQSADSRYITACKTPAHLSNVIMLSHQIIRWSNLGIETLH